MGTDLARALHRQALIQAEAAQAALPPQPTPHVPYEPPATALVTLTTAFDRIARAVRRCVALAQHLARPPAPARDPAQHRAAARKQVIRAVEDTIHRAANEGDRAESLTIELRERLDTPDLDWDLATRPIPDIIAELCRDLGLATPPGGARPWPRRTPADIHDLCTRAAAPSHQPGAPRPGPPHPSHPSAQPAAAPHTQGRRATPPGNCPLDGSSGPKPPPAAEPKAPRPRTGPQAAGRTAPARLHPPDPANPRPTRRRPAGPFSQPRRRPPAPPSPRPMASASWCLGRDGISSQSGRACRASRGRASASARAGPQRKRMSVRRPTISPAARRPASRHTTSPAARPGRTAATPGPACAAA